MSDSCSRVIAALNDLQINDDSAVALDLYVLDMGELFFSMGRIHYTAHTACDHTSLSTYCSVLTGCRACNVPTVLDWKLKRWRWAVAMYWRRVRAARGNDRGFDEQR